MKFERTIMKTKILFTICVSFLLAIMPSCNDNKSIEDRNKEQLIADSLADEMYEKYDQCMFADVIELGNNVLKHYEELHDTTSMSDIMATLCIAYQRLGNIAEGLEMSQRAIALDSIIGDNEMLSGDYNTIAGLYLTEDRAAEAEPFILKAIEYELQTDEQTHLPNRYGIASEIYCKLKQPEVALNYAQKGLALAEERRDSLQMGTRLSQLGDAYMALGRMSDAESTFLRCAEILETKQSIVSLAITYRQLGNVYEDRKQIDRAIQYYEKAAALARQTHYSMLLCQCTQAIGELTAGPTPTYSVQMLKESRALADTLHSHKIADLMAGFAAKFDLNEKQHTIDKQSAELQTHRIITTAFVIFIIAALALVSLAIGIKRLRRKREELEVRLSEKIVEETQHHEPTITEADKEFIDRLAKYVEEHLSESELSSTSIANAFCLSPRQFTRRVKQLTGIDTTHYIRASRIVRARHLLSHTELTIQEIYYQCGFESANYFSRTFRSDVGMTPTEYRKNHKENA